MHSDDLWKLIGIFVTFIGVVSAGIVSPRSSQESYFCSNRLETALDHIVRRTRTVSGGRSYFDLTPYSVYHSLYGGRERLSEKLDKFYDNGSQPEGKELPITKVEVVELRVRLPQNFRWVHVDKCHFNIANHTLDTRLIFPDLTISGRIILQPIGGVCSMILRLRHAGIEFRTVPLTTNEESRRSGSASVRTDSHFSEPGFLSVFAHGCRKNDEITKSRSNSKRKHIEKRLSYNYNEGGNLNRRYSPKRYDTGNTPAGADEDIVNFRDNFVDTVDDEKNARTFSQLFGVEFFDRKPIAAVPPPPGGYNGPWLNHHRPPGPHLLTADQPDADEIFSDSMQRQLEQLFSMGVRSLLTTYMQRALQPAIKETLMENMGYTLSYG